MKPLGNKIQLDIQKEKTGAIQSDAIEEHGTIIALGEKLQNDPQRAWSMVFPIGATLYFKAWAVDIITEGENVYYFISSDSDAICAIKYEN
jgi:co-chaperonin GroES (HSP10)